MHKRFFYVFCVKKTTTIDLQNLESTQLSNHIYLGFDMRKTTLEMSSLVAGWTTTLTTTFSRITL